MASKFDSCFDGEWFWMPGQMSLFDQAAPAPSIRYEFHDGGRPVNRRKIADCVYRAISTATGMAYADVEQFIIKINKTCPKSRTGVSTAATRKALRKLGWKFVGVGTGWTVKEDLALLPLDACIIVSARIMSGKTGHLFTMNRGTILDTFDPRERNYRISGYFVKTP